MQFRYNYFVFILRVLLLAFNVFVIAFWIYLFIIGELTRVPEDVILSFFLALFIPFFSWRFFISIREETWDILLTETEMIATRPFRFGSRSYQLSQLKGYSRSHVNWGTDGVVEFFESPSIVLYFKEAAPLELIRYNYFSWKKLVQAIEDKEVDFLGEEPWDTSMWGKRIFKYQ